MFALWDGPANAFNAAAPTWQQAEATATAGSLWEVGGTPPGSVWGDNYYWAAVGSATPGVAAFSTSLQLLGNFTGVPSGFFSNLQQQAPSGFGTPSEMSSLFSIGNPVALQGNTSFNTETWHPVPNHQPRPAGRKRPRSSRTVNCCVLVRISVALARLGSNVADRCGYLTGHLSIGDLLVLLRKNALSFSRIRWQRCQMVALDQRRSPSSGYLRDVPLGTLAHRA